MRLETTLPESLSAAFPILGEGSGRAGDLPADSWLAIAQPDLGKTISYFVDAVRLASRAAATCSRSSSRRPPASTSQRT